MITYLPTIYTYSYTNINNLLDYSRLGLNFLEKKHLNIDKSKMLIKSLNFSSIFIKIIDKNYNLVVLTFFLIKK